MDLADSSRWSDRWSVRTARLRSGCLVLLIAPCLLLTAAVGQTTLATLPQGNYGPVTNFAFPSSGYTIPSTASQITISMTISSADLADATKSLTVNMVASDDGGATWNHCGIAPNNVCAGFTWQGGGTNPKTGQPFTTSPVMVFDCAGLRGLKAQLVITANKAVNIGAMVAEQ